MTSFWLIVITHVSMHICISKHIIICIHKNINLSLSNVSHLSLCVCMCEREKDREQGRGRKRDTEHLDVGRQLVRVRFLLPPLGTQSENQVTHWGIFSHLMRKPLTVKIFHLFSLPVSRWESFYVYFTNLIYSIDITFLHICSVRLFSFSLHPRMTSLLLLLKPEYAVFFTHHSEEELTIVIDFAEFSKHRFSVLSALVYIVFLTLYLLPLL